VQWPCATSQVAAPPQETGVLQLRQPLPSASQVCTSAPEQRVRFSTEQSLWQVDAHRPLALSQLEPPGQAIGLLQALHPSPPTTHVWMSAPEHCVSLSTSQLSVQARAHFCEVESQLLPPGQVAGVVQVRQPVPSSTQVLTCVALTHCVAPAVAQVLVQAGWQWPVVGLQLLLPPQARAALQVRQPVPSLVQVSICAPEHWVSPSLVQSGVQTPSHLFEAGLQVRPPLQAAAAESIRQPVPSSWQVCTSVPTHTVAPSAVQSGVQVPAHWLVAALQVLPPLQATAADQARQPLVPVTQVCTRVPEHCVAPWLAQVLVQVEQALLLESQLPPVGQSFAAPQTQQPVLSWAQLSICEPTQRVSPDRQALVQLLPASSPGAGPASGPAGFWLHATAKRAAANTAIKRSRVIQLPPGCRV
jgi:hypothetical protein